MGIAKQLFESMLSRASAYRDMLNGFKLEDANLQPKDWLCVVGVNSDTRVRVRLEVEEENGTPQFVFLSSDRMNKWENGKTPNERRLTGDGTVPFAFAVPKFLEENNLVCVTPDDYGTWEFADKTATKLGGFHGILPNMNMLHRLIVRHFKERPDHKRNTWGRAAPGVSRDEWKPPMELDLKD